ncbi:ESF1 homolog isoform X2 [Apis laboriosa]|uniref:ESF1 homolog isoform X2 n=1 Tax=Apis laboriosa TaxID=183418 RepID=UPI001CC64609|nr:ESF1 homolog isoform X2 [Apis laboriosa]
MSELLNDERFAYIARDPKFKRIPKTERKVKIDKRFQSMFKDNKFKIQYTIDKRGRPINQTSSENLRKYYDLSSSEEESDEKEYEKSKQKEKKFNEYKKKDKKNEMPQLEERSPKNENEYNDSSDDNFFSSNGELLRIKPQEDSEQNNIESDSESNIDDAINVKNLKADLKESKKQLNVRSKSESKKLTDKIKEKLKDLSINYARGEGILMTDSSSDEESFETSDEEDIEHNWGELDKEAETTNEITHRLALCNMDWDRIRAVDLMVLFNSFLPLGGFISSIIIYPSEFGIQRMKEEELQGPKELTEMDKEKKNEDENDNEEEEGSAYHMEKLRQYQLNRLKYYYAVINFDSAETANKIYTECDGTEYESTATKLDLRFIPNDMEFDQTPKEICDKLPQLTKYQPRQFITTALQQVKVNLTWDETNPERIEIAQKLNSGKLNEINETDLQAYLATDSSDNEAEEEQQQKESQKNKINSEEETNADPVEKYKALLKEIEEKEEAKQKRDVELEFTWGLGTKEKAEKLVQERLKKDQNLTPFEQYLEKRKAKKKAKREERKKHRTEDESDSENSEMFNLDNHEKNNRLSHEKKNAIKSNNSFSSDDENEERRKAELELLLMDENEDNKQHFNMKKIEENATMTKSKQKRLNKKKNTQDQIIKDNFEVNVQDSRFNALFTSHHFNIDPADPHYRKTKGTEALIKEKLKRRANNDYNEEVPVKESKMQFNTELQTLIKSVKQNTKNISKPIK